MIKRIEAFQKRMVGVGDAALISSPQNIVYLSDFSFDDGYLLLFSDAAYLLTDFRYTEAAVAAVGGVFTVRGEGTHFATVRELLLKHGAISLLLEEEAVTLSLRARLEGALPGVRLVTGAGAMLSDMRQYKDEEELARITAAQEITEAAFSHILNFIRPLVTEREIALELEFFMRRAGAESVAFDTIAVSGSASSLPHGVPRDKALEKGFLTMDFGARYKGYCSDMTRTVVIGRADGEMKHLYGTVLAAQGAALAAASVGMSLRALDGVARDLIENAGYHGAFGHSLGHGVGIDIHENPRLSPKSHEGDCLAVGHVVTVEPGIYLAGRYGCRIEDMIVATRTGEVKNLTHATKEMIEIC